MNQPAVTIRALVKLCRISNLPTVWSNVFAAALLSGVSIASLKTLFLVVSLSLFYCGGMALNDICDLQSDREKQPFRPIPSGEISLKWAYFFALSQFSVAFLLLLATSLTFSGVMAGAVLLLLIVGYDLFHKGNPSTVLLMAGCRFMIYVVVALALAGGVSKPVLMLAIIQFVYIVILTLVARYENLKPTGFRLPVMPLLLAGICMVDGVYLGWTVSVGWLLIGVAGMAATLAAQRIVRGH